MEGRKRGLLGGRRDPRKEAGGGGRCWRGVCVGSANGAGVRALMERAVLTVTVGVLGELSLPGPGWEAVGRERRAGLARKLISGERSK